MSVRFGKYKKVTNRLMMSTVVGGEDYDRIRALSFPHTDVCASFMPKYWCNIPYSIHILMYVPLSCVSMRAFTLDTRAALHPVMTVNACCFATCVGICDLLLHYIAH